MAASKTAFLSTNVRNTAEIATWLSDGFIYEDEKDNQGYRLTHLQQLAYEIAVLINQESLLIKVGKKYNSAGKSLSMHAVCKRNFSCQ